MVDAEKLVGERVRAQVFGWRDAKRGEAGAPLYDHVPLYVTGTLTCRESPRVGRIWSVDGSTSTARGPPTSAPATSTSTRRADPGPHRRSLCAHLRAVRFRGAPVFSTALAALLAVFFAAAGAFAACFAGVRTVFLVVPAALPTALPPALAVFATAGLAALTVVSITGAAVAAIRKESIAFSADALRG